MSHINHPIARRSSLIRRMAAGGVAALLGLAAPAVRAQTIALSNFGEPLFASDSISVTHWEYQSFVTTGGDWAGTIQSIAIKDSSVSAAVYVANLFQGLPGSGTLVGSYTLSSDTGGVATFLPTASYTLTADTTYSFVLGTSSGTFGWDAANTYNSVGSGTFPAQPNMTFGMSEDGGLSWTDYTHDGSWPQYLEITTTAIPEPTTYGLLLGGATLGLVGWRRWRRISAV
jgi:hypothetical protein